MKRVLISFLILLSTVAFAIAQAPTPHVDPNNNPAPTVRNTTRRPILARHQLGAGSPAADGYLS
jgi:hypothetical protein